jgi:hypothetical protein
MPILIHFLNGNDLATQRHYFEKEYRNDIVIEIQNQFYEVYFFTETALKYEIRNDGFFSLPGLIIVDEVTNDKIINAITRLSQMNYFEMFIGKNESLLNNCFINLWHENDLAFTSKNSSTHLID